MLIDKDMRKQDLMALTKISPATMAKLSKGENINTDILVKICNALQCGSIDIMDIIPETPKGGTA